MPLGTGLSGDLLSLFDSPPDSIAGCAGAWASAMESYAAGVVPASTAVPAAAGTLESALVGAFGGTTAPADLEGAFLAFATAVGAGMAPAFVAVPPPAPVGFAAQLTTNQATKSAAASAFASSIDTWMRTGTATPSGGGAPVNWS